MGGQAGYSYFQLVFKRLTTRLECKLFFVIFDHINTHLDQFVLFF
jgi:hypothetical protein